MRTEFTPLDTDTRQRELVYASRAKLEHVLLNPEAAGYGMTFAGFGVNMETRERGTRELLTEAGALFEKQGLLTYDGLPRKDSWLLVRAILVCGTAWPWAGLDDTSAKLTAWWVGSSEALRILAYGHRDHLLGQGKTADQSDATEIATWWPSRADAYVHLLNDIAGHVVADDLQPPAYSDSDESLAEKVRGLESYFFSNSGVERAGPLERRGVFEMMLRVDHVVEADGQTTVMGSPLWVTRERRAVPGVYTVDAFDESSRQVTEGDWDGVQWRGFERSTYPERINLAFQQEVVTERIPLETGLNAFSARPHIEDIVSLGSLIVEDPQPSEPLPLGASRSRLQRLLNRFSKHSS